MKKHFLICLVVFLFSCETTDVTPKRAVTPPVSTTTAGSIVKEEPRQAAAVIANDPESGPLLPVCSRFYNEVCLSGLGSPDAHLNEKGYYVLELESYKKALQKTGIFTEAFVEQQETTFGACRDALEQEKITEEQAEGSIEMNNPDPCGFLHYAYYLNAQEDPDYFRLQETTITGNTARTEIHFYSGDNSWDETVYLVIILKKQGDQWFIDAVERIL